MNASGIDMSRDIQDRLALFGADTQVRRIALNFDQIEEYDPPPNPAKLTDSRAVGYIDRFGDSSWELDALDPATLNSLIVDEIDSYISWSDFQVEQEAEQQGRNQLQAVADNWEDAVISVGGDT